MESPCHVYSNPSIEDIKKDFLEFCAVARSKAEILEFLGVDPSAYSFKKYITAFVTQRLIEVTNTRNIKDPKQQYISTIKGKCYLKSIS